MKLVEESNVVQNIYDSLDVHVGQSASVLVTLNQPEKDYYIVASTRFTRNILTSVSVIHYTNSQTPVSDPILAGPTYQVHWSMQQAKTIRFAKSSDRVRLQNKLFSVKSVANDYDVPTNALLCGRAVGRHS